MTGKVRWCATVLLCTSALLLGGCVHASKGLQVRHYGLGRIASASAPARPATSPRHGRVLQIRRIHAPPWLTGTAMYYRLRYRGDDALAAYAQSDWIAPPASLLEPLIQVTISAGRQWRAVLGPGDAGASDASLHIRLDEFSQVFAHPEDSAGVIDATVTLVDSHGGNVLAQRHFHVTVAAPVATASGGAKALARASRELATRIRRWLSETRPGAT